MIESELRELNLLRLSVLKWHRHMGKLQSGMLALNWDLMKSRMFLSSINVWQ